ncbi:hypothetical protein CHH28_12900 [Bacterioplanes sanyensis]|uniref:YcxB-like C-terminal domain-containing protein n=1 Tax=Bacterioplanes sanyensis TaxID=1249553 RepID=A0A222FLQ0_9GAMM|nr:YcxB family protein [Bacterioplanes sanyensis]ASP39516.1 hypothetical protein CHH28_12900 [Bacterioplanes sanyensis]
MEVTINLEQQDWLALSSHLEAAARNEHKTWMDSVWFNFLVGFAIAILCTVVFNRFSEFHWPTAIVVASFLIALLTVHFFRSIKIRRSFDPLVDGIFCGKHTFTFSERGIESQGKGYRGVHAWSLVKKIERVSGMILIYLDTANAHVFPESQLESPDEFYRRIQAFHTHSTAQPRD